MFHLGMANVSGVKSKIEEAEKIPSETRSSEEGSKIGKHMWKEPDAYIMLKEGEEEGRTNCTINWKTVACTSCSLSLS